MYLARHAVRRKDLVLILNGEHTPGSEITCRKGVRHYCKIKKLTLRGLTPEIVKRFECAGKARIARIDETVQRQIFSTGTKPLPLRTHAETVDADPAIMKGALKLLVIQALHHEKRRAEGGKSVHLSLFENSKPPGSRAIPASGRSAKSCSKTAPCPANLCPIDRPPASGLDML